MRMSCVDPPGGVQLQRSNVKAGFDTVDNGDSNILAFYMKSHRGSVVIQEIGPCQGGKKGALLGGYSAHHFKAPHCWCD